MSEATWSALLTAATARLAAAGVDSPRADAEALLAHVLDADRGALLARVFAGAAGSAAEEQRFAAALERRAAREPLQHITGVAHLHGVTVAVGPGVFVPRPETELLVELGLAALAERAEAGPARVVDLCTGSGAVAAAVAAWATSRGREVALTAVELDPVALGWARRNLEPWGVEVRQGDALVAPRDLWGTVDVVLSNPPYVPEGERAVQPEALADPERALYGGDARGLRIPLGIARSAARLLRPGGVLAMEHHESQGAELVAALSAAGEFTRVRVHRDLTGRDRCVSAVRMAHDAAGEPGGPAPAGQVEEWPL